MKCIQMEIDVSGHLKINWNSGATATIIPKGKEIEICYEYKPSEIKKSYTIYETSRKTNCGEVRGMIMR